MTWQFLTRAARGSGVAAWLLETGGPEAILRPAFAAARWRTSGRAGGRLWQEGFSGEGFGGGGVMTTLRAFTCDDLFRFNNM